MANLGPSFAAATSSTLPVPLPETNLFRLSFVPHACALAHKYASCYLKLHHVEKKRRRKSFPRDGRKKREEKNPPPHRACVARARRERRHADGLLQNSLTAVASVIHTSCNGAHYWASGRGIVLPALIRLIRCRMLMGRQEGINSYCLQIRRR